MKNNSMPFFWNTVAQIQIVIWGVILADLI